MIFKRLELGERCESAVQPWAALLTQRSDHLIEGQPSVDKVEPGALDVLRAHQRDVTSGWNAARTSFNDLVAGRARVHHDIHLGQEHAAVGGASVSREANARLC